MMTPTTPASPGVTARPICRHCRKGFVNRPRGLCWNCYYTPGVREAYAITSKYAKRGVVNGCHEPPPCPTPTDAGPGSAGKVAVMAARAEAGVSLWHPADNLQTEDRMLALTRKVGETIRIGDDIAVTVVSVDRGGVKLGIVAPKDVAVWREELGALLKHHRGEPAPPAAGGQDK